ncbi:YusU family protein [Metabacillus fastidiosus]|uniref:YusU family protein n=1 Tax=Metabacillus fastidiosus TaxID=1458 RepID=A0ABU6P0S0_9BACI|nr:YusU family protein [Metabacillus fastidiosus]MED4402952.1 YusU family protein [Metabacillus fastidiosus]MED4454259.1 YusU family protein [Metabacillus fastidiosus]MED4461370.1 YusU family protein [Metabacillus fastidiosus]
MTKEKQQIDGLLEKYTELLLGETSEELKEKVQTWVLYNHIAKSMPPLVKHWNESYPEGREYVKELISEIKKLNEEHRANQKTQNR